MSQTDHWGKRKVNDIVNSVVAPYWSQRSWFEQFCIYITLECLLINEQKDIVRSSDNVPINFKPLL